MYVRVYTSFLISYPPTIEQNLNETLLLAKKSLAAGPITDHNACMPLFFLTHRFR